MKTFDWHDQTNSARSSRRTRNSVSTCFLDTLRPAIAGMIIVLIMIAQFDAAIALAQSPDTTTKKNVDRAQLAPPMNREARVKLAAKLMDAARKEAIADPKGKIRRSSFTSHYVQIDPVWTVNYILKNPNPEKNILYDNKAYLYICRNPDLIPNETVILLLKQEYRNSFIYLNQLLGNLPPEREQLRKLLAEYFVEATKTSKDEDSVVNLSALLQERQVASELKLDSALVQIDDSIEQFFRSGKAQKQLESLQASAKNRPEIAGYVDQMRSLFYQHAPRELNADFAAETSGGGNSAFAINSLLSNKELADEEKLATLYSIDQLEFGQYSHEYLPVTQLLGQVAQLD